MIDAINVSVIFNFCWRAIFRVIVNIHDVIIRVLLLKYWVKVFENVISVVVFVTWYNDTKWQLLCYWSPCLPVSIQVIFFFIWYCIIHLFLFDFTLWVELSTLIKTDLTIFHIEFLCPWIIILCDFYQFFCHFILLLTYLGVSHCINCFSVIFTCFFTHLIDLY